VIPGAGRRNESAARGWVCEQLRRVPRHAPLVVILDPDRVASDADVSTLGGQRITVTGWLQLRRAYEEYARDRPDDESMLVLHVLDGFRAATDLPWDIEGVAATVRLRWPVTGDLRELVRDMPAERSDAVVAAALRGGVNSALAAAFGVVLPGVPGREIEAVARLLVSPDAGPAAWRLIATLVRDPVAKAVAMRSGDCAPIQEAWRDWLALGTESPYVSAIEESRHGLAALFATGLLRPEPSDSPDLPAWAAIGVARPSPLEHIEALLANAPEPWPPVQLGDWFQVAAWWGQLRATAAMESPIPETLHVQIEDRWRELDLAFLPWLQENLGQVLLSTGTRPRTVDKVARFLARRLRESANRVLLLVLDGMGFAQWSILQRTSQVTVLEATACLAMVPTLTSISRQALFAGQVPDAFASTLHTTRHEPQQWETLWADEGVPKSEVRYDRIDGHDACQVPHFGDERAFGLVVSAIDRLLHGSAVLGDAQVASAVELWARHGFLESIIGTASAAGFEVWITSDHGNLPARPGGSPREGLAVEQAGTRVRLYPDRVLRDAARAAGVAWDPPGFPSGGRLPLFATGDTGFHSGGTKVSHGGLSMDEVVVPLVQVAP
jgi:PglZ domain